MQLVRNRRHRSAAAVMLCGSALIAAVLSPSATGAQAAPEPAPSGKIEPRLTETLSDTGGTDFWIRMSQRAQTSAAGDIGDWADRGRAVVDELTRTARESQQEVIEVLEAQGVQYQSFWVNNAILVESGTLGLAQQVADVTAVAEIRAPQVYTQPDPVEAEQVAAQKTTGVEWGIANINADDVWEQVGTRGEGIVVANIDSGVQFDHPALVDSYRGNNGDGTFTHDYNWFDATGTSEQPFEAADNSHGTHTMGTMAGDGGEGARVGVAPGVTWIAANGCAVCSEAHLAASAQWMLAPTDVAGLNPDAGRRPHIINNSWGSRFPSNDPLIEAILTAWADAGIFGVWANGNSGPACETSGSPGSRTINYSVGNHDSSNTINNLSSRGPGQDGTTKPDISAPGTDVRSAVQGGGYDVLSGTSMAAPHVSGAVALLWAADPTLVGDIDATRAMLDRSAVDTPDDQCGGTPEDNNVYGEGRLDALALVEGRTGPATGVLAGTVTDAATGEPVAHATVTATGVIERSVTTGSDGAYSLILSAGDYDVTVTAFGYADETSTAAVGENATTALDLPLTPFDTVDVSGTVRDGSGQGWPMYARVSVDGAPTPVYTDPFTGHYELELPANATHTVHVVPQYPGYENVEQVIDAAGEPVAFDVDVPVDAETCTAPGYEWGVSGLRSHFDGTTAPDGWTAVDNNGSGAVWSFDDPAGRGNQTGGEGGFAAFNADVRPDFVEFDSTLVSPVADLTGVSDPILTFLTDYRATTNATGEIDLSLDGGQTWTNVWRKTGGGLRGVRVTLDLPQAANQPEAQVRFHYTTVNVGFWQLDDVVLGVEHCDPRDGGLVAGHVVDGNTGDHLNGATVAGGDVDVLTAATPSDPAVPDGFYWAFASGLGATEFTATRAAYEPAAEQAEIATGRTARADFTLEAGHLVIEPGTVSSSQQLGTQESRSVTFRNDGAAPVDVTLRESGGTSSVLAAQSGAPVNRVETSISPGWHGHDTGTATTGEDAENSTPYARPWSYVPNYPMPIKDNGVVRGDDGTVYSIAGVTSGGRTENGMFAFDPESTSWDARAALSYQRSQPAAAWIDGRIYVVGGWAVNGLPVPELEIYSPQADRWTAGAAIPEAFAAPGVGVVDDTMYVVGGCDRSSCGSDTVYTYRPGTDSWDQVADYPQTISYPSCGGIGGKLYCAGGVTESAEGGVAVVAATYVYDPASDAWAPVASMPFGMWGSGHTAANGVLLVSGGATEDVVTNEGVAYDPAADRWTPIPNANETVVRGGSACGFYKVGGDSGGRPIPRAEVLPGYGSCGTSNDLTWLSADVEEFQLTAGESLDVTLTLDADAEGVDQPGEYTGRITVENGSPYGAALDIAMSVQPPRGWGEITGTVAGQRCDGSPVPIAGAVVAVDGRDSSYTLRTDADGVYSLWLDRRHNPLELVVASDGWRPEFRRSRVRPGSSVVEDFNLTTLFGCRSSGPLRPAF